MTSTTISYTRAAQEPRVSDPWLRTTLRFPASRCGPPDMVNGGWVAGTVAGHLGTGPVEVTLRSPTPPESLVQLRAADDDAALLDDNAVLVAARRLPGEIRPPAPVSWDEARGAEARYLGHHDHPFPGCFVCGTERAVGDGLRLFTGPVSGRPGAVAGLLTPHAHHATTGGRIPRATVWAALDCPSVWPHLRPGAAYLLGRMRAQVWSTLVVNEAYVVVGEAAGQDGRKAFSRSGVYDTAGRLVGAAEATWIRIQ